MNMPFVYRLIPSDLDINNMKCKMKNDSSSNSKNNVKYTFMPY